MTASLVACPPGPESSELQNAYQILCKAHDSTQSFLEISQALRRGRGAGAPTDQLTDLYRAMLIFSSAGLDSMVKQTIQDALPHVLDKNPGATEQFRSYVKRRLKQGADVNSDLLSRCLTDPQPRTSLIQELIRELTAASLQSKEELLKVAAFFNIPSKELCADLDLLDEIFTARNQISHEMDVNLKSAGRKRRPRRATDMLKYTNTILTLAATFLGKVEKRLA